MSPAEIATGPGWDGESAGIAMLNDGRAMTRDLTDENIELRRLLVSMISEARNALVPARNELLGGEDTQRLWLATRCVQRVLDHATTCADALDAMPPAPASALVDAVRAYLAVVDATADVCNGGPLDWTADEREAHENRAGALYAVRKLVTP